MKFDRIPELIPGKARTRRQTSECFCAKPAEAGGPLYPQSGPPPGLQEREAANRPASQERDPPLAFPESLRLLAWTNLSPRATSPPLPHNFRRCRRLYFRNRGLEYSRYNRSFGAMSPVASLRHQAAPPRPRQSSPRFGPIRSPRTPAPPSACQK